MYKFERNIPLDTSYDVIVVGGGPSGCTAAIASAREGARTLLIEATSALGGMGTNGLVPAWCPFSDKEKIIYRGLAEKIFTAVKKEMPHIKPDALDWVPIDHEVLKRVYDDMVITSGAKILFNTFLSAVETDDKGNVTAIIVSNKSGLKAYQAKVYVDCTGDADLAFWAGAKWQKGEDNTGLDLQPATHCFVLTNVDMYGYMTSPHMHGSNPNSIIHQILADGKYPLIPDGHVCHEILGPGTIGFNAGHIWKIDNTKPETVSEGLILGRKIAEEFRKALAHYNPSTYGNAFLVSTGSLLGVRESRRIIGDYILTVDDYASRKSFPDEICRNSYYIDVHGSKAAALAKGKLSPYGVGESHGIPYRCLTPKGLNNVLVAGRSISCERMVQGSIRVMPTCLAMGEAAGLAASLAASNDGKVRDIDVQHLRKRLLEEGAYIL
ncbi:MAG: FAD-dependent oxidoreductase [Bacilli bacterium]|nr:FAD-dependent oxidoreductase [Bacilli bacterium]